MLKNLTVIVNHGNRNRNEPQNHMFKLSQKFTTIGDFVENSPFAVRPVRRTSFQIGSNFKKEEKIGKNIQKHYCARK